MSSSLSSISVKREGGNGARVLLSPKTVRKPRGAIRGAGADNAETKEGKEGKAESVAGNEADDKAGEEKGEGKGEGKGEEGEGDDEDEDEDENKGEAAGGATHVKHPQHRLILIKRGDKPWRWDCDGCDRPIPETYKGARYRCVAGCDFDLCGACFRSASATVSVFAGKSEAGTPPGVVRSSKATKKRRRAIGVSGRIPSRKKSKAPRRQLATKCSCHGRPSSPASRLPAPSS